MIDILRTLFGTYTPITYGADSLVPAGLSGVNMEYVFQAILFIVVVYSFFRIVGLIISKL